MRTAAGGVGQAVRFDLSRALETGAADAVPSELRQLAAVDHWRRFAQGNQAQPCRADDVDRHPDRDLARWPQLGPGQIAIWMLCGLIQPGRVRSLAGSDRLDVVRLIRPAFPVERGRLDRLGRAPLLHALDLAAGLAVPSCVRRVLRSHAVGH